MRTRALLIVAALVATTVLSLPPASAGPGVPVYRFADGAVVGTSQLVRTTRGIGFNVSTTQLVPGDAYTLWVVIFNNPAGCLEPTELSMCGDSDVGNPDAMPDIVYGAGNVAGGSGTASFGGHRRIGDNGGSISAPIGLPAFGLVDAAGAEIHLVVHQHGPMLSAFMPDMIKTVAGGCTDAGIPEPGVESPFNDYTGPEYGRRGPNTCQSVQFAVHQP